MNVNRSEVPTYSIDNLTLLEVAALYDMLNVDHAGFRDAMSRRQEKSAKAMAVEHTANDRTAEAALMELRDELGELLEDDL